jgi:hypothetical protein
VPEKRIVTERNNMKAKITTSTLEKITRDATRIAGKLTGATRYHTEETIGMIEWEEANMAINVGEEETTITWNKQAFGEEEGETDVTTDLAAILMAIAEILE